MSAAPDDYVLCVILPPGPYERLAAVAAEQGRPLEELAAELLAEVARYGAPGELHAVARLAAQAADELAARLERAQGRG